MPVAPNNITLIHEDKLTDKQKEIEPAKKEADKWMMISDTAKW